MKNRWKYGIRYKLCCSYMALVLLPTIMTGILLYMQMVGSVRAQLGEQIAGELAEQAAEIQQRTLELEEAARNFLTLNEIVQYANGLYFDESDLIIAYNQRVRAAFSWFDIAFSDSIRLNLFVDADDMSEDGHFHRMSDYREETWFLNARIQTAQQIEFWETAHPARSYRYSRGGSENVFSFFTTSSLVPRAMMEMEIEAGELLDLDAGFACLNAETMEIIGSGSPLGVALDSQTLEQAQNELAEVENRVMLRAEPIQSLGVVLVHWADTEELTLETKASLRLFLCILLLLTVLLFVLTWILSGGMSKRIRCITCAAESMYRGNYDVKIPVDADDELGTLSWQMNALAARIDNLLNKVLLAEIGAKDAELRALQAQINPHFIYNTLETFCMMSELGDSKRLTEGIVEMGELMRYNLSGKRQSTLQEELHNVQLYLGLQNLVNNDRIVLTMDSPDELNDTPMPKLLLQPVVENAILHGMDYKRKLNIRLSVRREGEKIVIRVNNDGKPIAPERLEQVNEILRVETFAPETAFEDCLALTNINRRLKLLYGAGAQVSLYSEEVFTEVLIRIPYDRRKEHEGADCGGPEPHPSGTQKNHQ